MRALNASVVSVMTIIGRRKENNGNAKRVDFAQR
jgi:hypothetical protein